MDNHGTMTLNSDGAHSRRKRKRKPRRQQPTADSVASFSTIAVRRRSARCSSAPTTAIATLTKAVPAAPACSRASRASCLSWTSIVRRSNLK